MSSKDPIPLWLDVDTGHDDAFALLLAARHPGLDLLGVSTTFGNAPLDQTTYNTRAILKAIGREDVPVFSGAAGAFCRQTWHAPEVHGASGLDGTTCLPEPSVPVKGEGAGVAVKAMHDALSATAKGTAWLVPTGALTNTALLFASYPKLGEHLAGVSIMGGAIGGSFTNAQLSRGDDGSEWFGNWSPYAEFNIYIDPESARAVLEKNRTVAGKCSMVTLDLSHLFLATGEVKKLLSGSGGVEGEVRKLFLEILEFFSKTYADVFGLTDGPPVHDLLAVAVILMPEAFDDRNGERFRVDVVTDGVHGPKGTEGGKTSQCGRTVAKAASDGEKGVRIMRGVDQIKVWKVLEECLGRAEEATRGAR